MMTQCEDELVMGEYGERYTTLQQIGKGAYGYVKMAYRKEDSVLVSVYYVQGGHRSGKSRKSQRI